MKKARYKSGLVLLCLIISLIPPVSGNGWPEEQTRHIQAPPPGLGKDNDMFVTEAGIGHHGPLVTVLDPNMDIYGYLFFKDIKLNSYFYLENATLRLRTASTLDFDNESSFTIYGINDYIYFGMGEWGYGSPGEIMNAPLTSANVPYNSSQFYGSQWWEIDVTNIVQELKSNPWYEGPGLDFNDPGDYMAFIILGSEGHDSRWFYDLSAGNGYEAQLHLHWDFSPPPPVDLPDDAEFNETYGNYTIWKVPTSNLIDMAYWNGTHEQYMEVNTNSSDVEIESVSTQGNKPASYQIVRGPGEDIFYLGRVGTNQTLFHSYDEGETWYNFTLNDQYAELIGNSNKDGSLALDSSGDLWIVWSSKTLAFPVGEYRVCSTNVTITEHVLTFNDDVEYIPDNRAGYTGCDQNRPSLWIDGNNRKHLAHDGFHPPGYGDQVYYLYKDDGAWTGKVLLSSKAPGRDYWFGNIVTSQNGTFIVVVWDDDAIDISCKYYKTVWTFLGVGCLGCTEERGGHVAYNDNEDKVLLVYEDSLNLYSQIFNFSDETVTPYSNIGVDGLYPDLTFDYKSNDALMVYDAGADGLQGIIYDFDTESWGTNFTIRRNIDPGYIHTVSLATIDIGGGEPDEEWYVHETDVCNVTGPFDDIDDAEDWIDEEDPDPEDPDPGGEWSEGPGGETGAFTRFRMRLWFLAIGFGCLFGPVLFFAWKRPSGYYLMVGSIVMLIGLGMLLSIGQV